MWEFIDNFGLYKWPHFTYYEGQRIIKIFPIDYLNEKQENLIFNYKKNQGKVNIFSVQEPEIVLYMIRRIKI